MTSGGRGTTTPGGLPDPWNGQPAIPLRATASTSHGEWDKAQQRYEDGCKSGTPEHIEGRTPSWADCPPDDDIERVPMVPYVEPDEGRGTSPERDPRSVAVKRTLPRLTLHRWTWTPVLDGKWRTGVGGFALTRRGAIRKGRRWHREDERVLRHIYAPTEYAPAGSRHV